MSGTSAKAAPRGRARPEAGYDPRPSMARIILITPDKQRTTYELDGRAITVGRTPANSIRVEDGAASRKHCLIKAVGDAWILTDLGSANGTKVNGSRIAKHEEIDLSDGDRIKIGKTVLAFKE